MACGLHIPGMTLLWFVLCSAALLVRVPYASGFEPGRNRSGNLGDEETSARPNGAESRDAPGDMTGRTGKEASYLAYGLKETQRELPEESTGKLFPDVAPLPYNYKQGHPPSAQALVIRSKRQNPKLHLQDDPPKARLPGTPWLGGRRCGRPPTNPTVVAGIVGGAVAFFLVVVLTIVYCSYRNNPPADVRKKMAEIYAYMRGLEEGWVGVANSQVGVATSRVGVTNPRVGVANPLVGVVNSRVGVSNHQMGVVNFQVGVANTRTAIEQVRCHDNLKKMDRDQSLF